jgi:hypothetical protein
MARVLTRKNILGRVKRGTGLWDGRRVRVLTEVVFSNGRVAWEAVRERGTGRAGWMHHDRREFAPHEIEVIEELAV